jgi:dsDNA-specific endonuclease/ATPase MutS2
MNKGVNNMNLNTILKNIRDIDNMNDLVAINEALRDQHNVIKKMAARAAKAVYRRADKIKMSNGKTGTIIEIKRTKAVVDIEGERWRVPLTMIVGKV